MRYPWKILLHYSINSNIQVEIPAADELKSSLMITRSRSYVAGWVIKKK